MKRLSISWNRNIITVLLFTSLLGCSPLLNWRKVSIGSINAMLPCKPDQAKRMVSLAGEQVELSMIGCEADDALFAISYIQVESTEKAHHLMHSWKEASLSNMQGKETKTEQGSNNVLNQKLKKEEQLNIHANGINARGNTTQAQLRWAVIGLHIYHWAVYAEKIKPEHLEPMFES